MLKRIISIIVLSTLMVGFCFSNAFATMSNHTDTVSYPAGGYGFSPTNNKNEYATQYSTRLTGVGFIGLPAGQFPSTTTNIYFTPCDANRGNAAAAPRNYHNKTHMLNNTVKHDYYYNGSPSAPDYRQSGYSICIRVDSNYNLGNTVGLIWNLGYVSSLP